MLRLSITIMAVLFTISVYSQTPTEQIDNWNKLDQTQQDKATELLASISTEEANVLDEFKIPVNMTYYSTNLNKKYQGKYSNNKTDSVIVGYVPLQFVNSYETELQKSYDDRGALKSVPRLEVILAIHYTESNYIPSAIAGTKTNPSFGMLQLTLSTAKDLYRTDKETYDDFFSISDGKVVFPSTEKQIALTIKFLPDEKKYTRTNETNAIISFNGSGDDAKNYAAVVLSRARLYKKMKSLGQDISSQIFTTEYSKPEVKEVINTQLQMKGYEPLTDGEYKEAIDKAILTYEYKPATSTDNITLPTIDNGEIKKVSRKHLRFPPIPTDGCEYYLKVEEGRTLYSYFLNIKDMVYTICNEKNAKFSLFYSSKAGKKVLKSLYDIDQKNNSMQTDVKAGDIIYLPSDVIIKGDKETLKNLSRICPDQQGSSVGSEEQGNSDQGQ